MVNLLQLGSASIQQIYNKFRDLRVFERLNPAGYFDNLYLLIYSSKEGNKLKLKNGVTIKEFKKNLPSFLHILRVIVGLCIFVKTNDIPLIHAKGPYAIGLVALIVSRITGVPYCVSLHADYEGHGTVPSSPSRAFWRRVEKEVYKHAIIIMPIREQLKNRIIKKGVPEDKIRIMPHGIPLKDYTSKTDSKIMSKVPRKKKHIISVVARLDPVNCPQDYIKIASRLKEKRNDFVMAIAGDGVETDIIRKSIKEDRLEENVKLLGFISSEDVIALRRGSVINLSLIGGFSLIEACAAGKPVIAYDTDWHYELVKNGTTGFLVPKGDVDLAAEKVDYLLDNPKKAKEMGQNARELCFKNHSIENTDKIKIDIYEECLRLKDRPESSELIRESGIEQMDRKKRAWYTSEQSLDKLKSGAKRTYKRYQEIIRSCIPKKNIKLLDCGAGDGENLKILLEYGDTYAIDYNELRVKRAKKRFPKAKIFHRNALDTKFKDNFFDFILLNQVMEHIHEDKRLLLEMKRILKPKGTLVVGVPNEGCFLAKIRNHILQRNILKSTDHVHFYTVKDLKKLASDSGLKIKRIHTVGFFIPLTYLHSVITSIETGSQILNTLGRFIPSQVGALYIKMKKEDL